MDQDNNAVNRIVRRAKKADPPTGTEEPSDETPVVIVVPAPPESVVIDRDVTIEVERGCPFMVGVADADAASPDASVLLHFVGTEKPAMVFGRVVENGPNIPLFEVKWSAGQDAAPPTLRVRDALPSHQAIGISENGPWISKTRFIHLDVPEHVPAPLYLRGQGRLGSLRVGQLSPAPEEEGAIGVSPAPLLPIDSKQQPRSWLHRFIRSFNPRRCLVVVSIVVLVFLVFRVLDSHGSSDSDDDDSSNSSCSSDDEPRAKFPRHAIDELPDES
jgi:hypothetical protein